MKQQTQTNEPFLKVALALWVLGLIGAFLVLPYVAALAPKALAAAAARTHIAMWEVVALSVAQSAVLLAVAVFAGLWAAQKLGLGAPLIRAYFSRKPPPEQTRSTLLLAVAIGVATGFALIALDRRVFTSFPSVAAFIASAQSAGGHPKTWQALLASFYGAFDEEILMRLGLLSLLALAFRRLTRSRRTDPGVALPTDVFWAANIVTALLFGLGHLPATAAIAPLTTALVIRAIALNGIAGLVFGVLYKRYGLEWAMASHFTTDIVVHIAFG